MHFFTQSFLSFLKTCPYHLNLCRCTTLKTIPSLSSVIQSVTLTPLIHLIIVISAHQSVNSFSFFTGHVSLRYNIQLHIKLLYNFPLIRNEMFLLVSRGICTSCLNLFHPLHTLAFTAASASPSTLSMSLT